VGDRQKISQKNLAARWVLLPDHDAIERSRAASFGDAAAAAVVATALATAGCRVTTVRRRAAA
jgi:hypothetical protein